MQESLIERTDIADYYATHDNEFLYLFIDVKSPGHNQAMKQSGFIYISIAAVKKMIENELAWHFLQVHLIFCAKILLFTTLSQPTKSGYNNHKTGIVLSHLNHLYLIG